MTVKNATPHSISFFNKEDLVYAREGKYLTLKNQDIKPVKKIDSTFTYPLKVHKNYFDAGMEIEEGVFLRDSMLNTTSLDPIPNIDIDNDILVVSEVYAQIAAPRIDPRIADIMYTIDEPVKQRLQNGYLATIGCTGLKKVTGYASLDFYVSVSRNLYVKRKALEFYEKNRLYLLPNQIESLNCLEAQVFYANRYDDGQSF